MKIIALVLTLMLMCTPVLAQEGLVPLSDQPTGDAQWGQLLIGSWCEDAAVGSGYGERCIFTQDALYLLPSQYGISDTGVYDWVWSVKDGQLLCGPGGDVKALTLAGPYQVPEDEAPYSPKILINGKTFYQYSSDPAYFPDLADYGLKISESIGSPKAEDDSGNWWDNIGVSEETQGASGAPEESAAEEPPVESTPEPGLDIGGLFSSLLGGKETEDPAEETEDLSFDLFEGLLGDEETEEPEEPEWNPVPEPTPEPGIEPEGYEEVTPEYWEEVWGNALFGPNVSDIPAHSFGGAVQYASVGDWVVAYGSCDDHYCIFGWNVRTSEYRILAETVVSDIVPAGDVFAYYGEVKKGKFGWLVMDPDESGKPESLGISESSSVFWADSDYFYYYTYGKGTSVTYYRVDHQGKKKKKLGTLNGRGIAINADGGVVVYNSAKNRVQLFKDGKHTTLYDPDVDISNVLSNGEEIWVVQADSFGRLVDGEVSFRFPGSLRGHMVTGDHIIGVLDNGGVRLKVMLFNDDYRAYTTLGEVIAQDGFTVEVTPGRDRIVVWGPRESLEFYAPGPEQFIPYGYYDIESARAAGYEAYGVYDYGD